MKKISALLASAVFVPVVASANPGCGLGSQVFDGQEGLPSHVLAATTNGILGNQTFGMTSGTLGCDTSETIQYAAIFVNKNMEELAENMATGEGEVLLTLATLLEVESPESFAVMMQQNFAKIFTSPEVTAEEVIANIKALMA